MMIWDLVSTERLLLHNTTAGETTPHKKRSVLRTTTCTLARQRPCTPFLLFPLRKYRQWERLWPVEERKEWAWAHRSSLLPGTLPPPPRGLSVGWSGVYCRVDMGGRGVTVRGGYIVSTFLKVTLWLLSFQGKNSVTCLSGYKSVTLLFV